MSCVSFKVSFLRCHLSCEICPVPYVGCHLSGVKVRSQLSGVIFQVSVFGVIC